jgi:cytochrome c peroxidase
MFKVPTLRNIARTAPYFHDGSIVKLEQAVDAMARYQLGVELSVPDRDALVAFLLAQNGRMSEARP